VDDRANLNCDYNLDHFGLVEPLWMPGDALGTNCDSPTGSHKTHTLRGLLLCTQLGPGAFDPFTEAAVAGHLALNFVHAVNYG